MSEAPHAPPPPSESTRLSLSSQAEDAADLVSPVRPQAEHRGDLPERIGPYRVRRQLGRGSRSVVFLGERGGEPVAIKLLQGRTARAGRQAQEAAQLLRDPGIVPVYGLGEHQGHPYYAMEYCPGPTLRDGLQQEPLAPIASARLLRELARAVGVAHAAQVVHRDLRPAKIVIEPRSGRPRVMDFGLADGCSGLGSLALSQDLPSTACYMAPEQFLSAEHADERVDIYALGAILYECLTGRRPYGADNVVELAQVVRRGGATRPCLLDPGIPARLEAICARAMARLPEDRYPRAADMVTELDAFISNPWPAPSQGWRRASESPPPRLLDRQRAAPLTKALAAAFSCVLVALVVVLLYPTPDPVDAFHTPLPLEVADSEPPPEPLPTISPREALGAVEAALSGEEVQAWLDALAQAKAVCLSPQDRQELESFLAAAWEERSVPLLASLHEIAPYDPELPRQLRRLEKMFPDHAGEALLARVEYLRRRAVYDEALRAARRLQTEHDGALSLEAQRVQVLCLWRMGRGLRSWRPVLDSLAASDTAAGAYGRAVRDYVQGQSEPALEAAEEALRLDPGYLPAKIIKVWLLGQSDRYEEAEAYEATFAAEAEDDPYLIMERTRRRSEQGLRYQGMEAAQLLQLLIENRDPELRQELRRLSQQVQSAHGRTIQASRTLQADPGNVEARFRRGIMSFFMGELDPARRDLQEAFQSDPDQFDQLLEKGALTGPERAWLEAQITR